MRFNRGLGWTFWLATSVAFVMVLPMLAVSLAGRFPWWIPLLVFAVWMVVVFVLRLIQGPPAALDFAHGTVHTRGGEHPFFEVTSLGLRNTGRAGIWLNIGVGTRFVTRCHISGGFFRAPDLTQWHAIRHFLALKMQMHWTPDGQYLPPPRSAELPPIVTLLRPETQISAAEALQILDAQIQWVSTGQRASSRKAPLQALMGRYVRF